jgi:hypothetical protein
MGMKESKLFYSLVLVGIIILAGFAIFRLYQINQKTKQELPYLLQGENIECFDLVDEDAQQVDASVFSSGRPALIFIFSRPCSPCDKNIVYWRKMREILEDQVDFYGIIPGNATKAFNFSEKAKLNFKLYVPVHLNEFIQKMRLKLNFSQTILYARGEVKYLKLGKLEGEEAVNIINMAKELI